MVVHGQVEVDAFIHNQVLSSVAEYQVIPRCALSQSVSKTTPYGGIR